MKFNKKTDLTRWNRSGLSEFRYIDGNAITYLETLRQQLVEEYERQGKLSWEELVTRFREQPNETRSQTVKRLRNQYYDERRDYAWEILRSFARSAHVLGEYTNAYANEAYLPTAVEWDNIRKLVAMLGYRPAPPSSAETYIALLLKAGESGDIEKGFAVKNNPANGEATVIFETQEKLTGSDSLNQLYLKDWNKNFTKFKNRAPFKFAGIQVKGRLNLGPQFYFPLSEIPEDINVGDLGVLATTGKGIPVKVVEVSGEIKNPFLELQSLSGDVPDSSYRYYNSTLYLQPGFVESPLAYGDGSASLKEKIALAKDEIVFTKKGTEWRSRRVQENEFGQILFDSSEPAPVAGEKLYRALILKPQSHVNLDSGKTVYVLPHGDYGNSGIIVDNNLNKHSVVIKKQPISDSTDDVDHIYYITGDYGERIYWPAEKHEAVISRTDLEELRFPGKAKGLESGGWAFVTYKDHSLSASRISEIRQEEQWFELDLNGDDDTVSLLRSAFKLSLQPRDHDVNSRTAWSTASTDAVTVVELEDMALIGMLKPGKKLICAGTDYAVLVELKDIVSDDGMISLHLSPPFHLDKDAAGLKRHDCLLYGNVARASHGETQPEKILGNGDATQTRQRFKLPSDKISWVADPLFSSGVRADLTMRIGQRVWQQVENISHSAPEDYHYQVEVDEDGVLEVCFGDGRRGRRLPTGVDNIRVRYRTGYGEEGNLDPYALEKIARPHPLLDGFVAPLACSGGAEKEGAESMRESAPATVLALERAVSLNDFTHLAAHHSMIWQARAFEKMPDRPARPLIEVVVVAAGGATFNPGSEMALKIQSYLKSHASPDTPVSVISYSPVLMDIKVSVMLDETAFDRKQVELAVLKKLKSELALKQRCLGQPLFRSEVIALIEQVEGVKNGHCEILDTPYVSMSADSRPRLHKADDGGIRRISVKSHQLLYLDVSAYEPTVSILEYQI